VSTPAPRYFCPRCRASYNEQQRFCSECGADMLRASALDLAAVRETADPSVTQGGRPDRRMTASNQAWLGKLIDGRYRVIEVLGRGGMGVVYKVEHVRMGKIAAMKVLHRDLAEDPEVVHRFEREAAAVSKLQHPNTVQVFDFGTANDALYLVMEHVRGLDLAHIVDRDGPLPFARAAPLLVQILGALGEAHELGIVHRDLKPENILITRTTGGRDFAKVLDFGLAKLTEPGARDPDLSDHGQIVGTPYFMAPEQIRGEDVDARTDIYALGALTYKVLTGEYPHIAKNAVGVLTKHLTADVERPSTRAASQGVAPDVDEIVLRAMAKDPAERFQSAAEMAAAVEAAYAELVGDGALVSGGAIGASRSSGRRRVVTEDDGVVSDLALRRSDIDGYERSLKRQRLVVTISSVVLVAGIAAAGVWWTMFREPPARRHEREPNDEIASATRIAPDTKVTGYLGKRLSKTDPDHDFFRLEAKGPQPIVTARVTSLPNVDITLTLRDGSGRVIATVDEQDVGGGEALHRRRGAPEMSIEVGEVMSGTWPVENVSDPYTLEVTVENADGTWEIEPNAETSDATPVSAGATVRGYLDARADVDCLRWDGPDGDVLVDVAAPGGVAVLWTGPDGAARSGRGTLKLRHGDAVRLRRADRDQGKGTLAGAEAPWSATLTPAR
jgi:eukaryotic-like serine/threonine-protein kinase